MKTFKLSQKLNFLRTLKTKAQEIGKRKLLIYGGVGLIFIGSLIGTWFLCDYIAFEYFDFELPVYINLLIVIGVIQFWIGVPSLGLRNNAEEIMKSYEDTLDNWIDYGIPMWRNKDQLYKNEPVGFPVGFSVCEGRF
jgi:hypothetical protein